MTQEKLSQFIRRNRIRMNSELTDTNPQMASDADWMRSATHWKVTLRCRRRQLSTYFSQGPAIAKEPTAEDVLDCLASDAASVETAGSFEEWARELGFDTDSRKAEKTYAVCERQAGKLRDLINDPQEYDKLLYHTERL